MLQRIGTYPNQTTKLNCDASDRDDTVVNDSFVCIVGNLPFQTRGTASCSSALVTHLLLSLGLSPICPLKKNIYNETQQLFTKNIIIVFFFFINWYTGSIKFIAKHVQRIRSYLNIHIASIWFKSVPFEILPEPGLTRTVAASVQRCMA